MDIAEIKNEAVTYYRDFLQQQSANSIDASHAMLQSSLVTNALIPSNLKWLLPLQLQRYNVSYFRCLLIKPLGMMVLQLSSTKQLRIVLGMTLLLLLRHSFCMGSCLLESMLQLYHWSQRIRMLKKCVIID